MEEPKNLSLIKENSADVSVMNEAVERSDKIKTLLHALINEIVEISENQENRWSDRMENKEAPSSAERSDVNRQSSMELNTRIEQLSAELQKKTQRIDDITQDLKIAQQAIVVKDKEIQDFKTSFSVLQE